MKKTLVSSLMCVLLIIILSGCGCEHEWVSADCMNPKQCSLCGKTEGEPILHQYSDATCVSPKTCTMCGLTEGTAVAHRFISATCCDPETCENCGLTRGLPADHNFTEANCQAPLTCQTCGLTLGDITPHSFGNWHGTDSAAERNCSACGAVENGREYSINAKEFIVDTWIETYSQYKTADLDSYIPLPTNEEPATIVFFEDGTFSLRGHIFAWFSGSWQPVAVDEVHYAYELTSDEGQSLCFADREGIISVYTATDEREVLILFKRAE